MNKRVSFSYEITDHCQACGKDFEESEKRFPGLLHVHSYTPQAGKNKGITTQSFSADCLCRNCLLLDFAHAEAKDEQRRVTQICAGLRDTNMAYFFGARCLCGRVTHANHDDCFVCQSESRMLKKSESEAKQLRKILTELNREIKEQIKSKKEHHGN